VGQQSQEKPRKQMNILVGQRMRHTLAEQADEKRMTSDLNFCIPLIEQ